MPRVLVIHYQPAEAAGTAERIRREGFEAEVYTARGAQGIPGIRARPPDAIVFDLARMPSYARVFGAMLRESKSTRMIPLVYIQGDPAKTRLVRDLLPDAVFTTPARLGAAIQRAIQHAPAEPAMPRPRRRSLLGKLCVKTGSGLALLNAPEEFLDSLGKLPEGARLEREAGKADIILLFVRSGAVLGRELPRWARDLRRGQTLWIIWPKTASKSRTDLTMPRIVALCSNLGLSGYKVCAVDETWSGLAVSLPRRRR